MGRSEALQGTKLFLDKGVLDQWNNNRYTIYTSVNKGIRVVILGEEHLRQQREQIDLINIIKPSYVLHESLGGWTYDPKVQKFIKPKGRLFDNVGDHPLLKTVGINLFFRELSDKLGFKIIGCDLTDAEILEAGKSICVMFPKKYRYEESSERIWRTDHGYHLLSFDELVKDENIMFYRNRQMVKIITKYEALSEKPILVVMGGTHGDSIHEDMMQRKKFGYAYVKQYANLNLG